MVLVSEVAESGRVEGLFIGIAEVVVGVRADELGEYSALLC